MTHNETLLLMSDSGCFFSTFKQGHTSDLSFVASLVGGQQPETKYNSIRLYLGHSGLCYGKEERLLEVLTPPYGKVGTSRR